MKLRIDKTQDDAIELVVSSVDAGEMRWLTDPGVIPKWIQCRKSTLGVPLVS